MTLDEYYGFIRDNNANFDGSVIAIDVNGIRVNVRHDEELRYLYLFASLGSYGEIDKDKLLHWLSEINIFGIRTDGGHVFLNETIESVIFSKRESFEDIKVDQFNELLKGFAETQLSLVNRLKDISSSDGEQNPTSDDQYQESDLQNDAIIRSLGLMV